MNEHDEFDPTESDTVEIPVLINEQPAAEQEQEQEQPPAGLSPGLLVQARSLPQVQPRSAAQVMVDLLRSMPGGEGGLDRLRRQHRSNT